MLCIVILRNWEGSGRGVLQVTNLFSVL